MISNKWNKSIMTKMKWNRWMSSMVKKWNKNMMRRSNNKMIMAKEIQSKTWKNMTRKASDSRRNFSKIFKTSIKLSNQWIKWKMRTLLKNSNQLGL